MKPSIWPDWMDHLKAKSAQYGGETLADHTWDVLVKLAELRRLRPNLPSLCGVPQLWHCLFWACLLHDFGKAARGFQARLAGGPVWPHRHEVLSLVFLDVIAAGLSEEEQRWVLAAIVSHHRDAVAIAKLYPDVGADPLVPLLGELDVATAACLWRWLDVCAVAWRDALGMADVVVAPIALAKQDIAITMVCTEGVARVRRWLERYADWVDDLPNEPPSTLTLGILLRGLTTSADHMASAHLLTMPAPLQEEWRHLAMRIRRTASLEAAEADAYTHQRKSAAAGGSAMLVAPTGSAKTESALYWALGDGAQPIARLFYALPYQASMNAMYDRLRHAEKGFGDDAVGLQHGRAVQALHARLLDSEEWAASAAKQARWAKNINTLNARPLKIFSPYQMLKAMFQLRGFEAMLSDYAGAAFVFDEIHAYEPQRLALILALIRYLRERFQARFFVMSATFPTLIRSRLAEALGAHTVIEADAAVFQKFRRHRLQLLDGDLLRDGVAAIVRDVQAGKQVLVCVNTVKRAQEIYAALAAQGLGADELLLIHSRYTFADRNEKEAAIRDRCGVDVPLDARQPLALIATQVVEVSLNIDLDTIYSDPAPLEALLQRFGRVNRQCLRGICPVHVFSEPNDGQGVYGRHRDKAQRGHIVRVTLAELERHNATEIDEAAINGWLDAIYADAQLRVQWEAEYQQMLQQAATLLRSLRPFNSDERKEEEFEKMFDGVEVVPRSFEQQYVAHLMQDEFIEASNYLVSISKQKFAMLMNKGLVQRAEAEGKRGAWVVRLPYSEQSGLQLDALREGYDDDWS